MLSRAADDQLLDVLERIANALERRGPHDKCTVERRSPHEFTAEQILNNIGEEIRERDG